MKTAVFVLGMLASVAIAQPHAHKHRRRAHSHHNKRALVTEWVTETVYETVTELVDESTTETILPSSKFVPPKAAAATTSTQPPGQFFEGASAAPKAPVETSPPAAAPYVPESTSTSMALPADAPSAQSPPPPPAPAPAPAPSPEPVAPPPPVNNSPPPPPQVQVANPAPAGANPYSGDLTFFKVGLGACGFDDTGRDNNQNIVALSYLLMGDRSNDNPMCGRTITISYGGKTTTATVRDKCMGCAHDNIDASEALFTFFNPLGTGRFQVQWWFND